MTLADRLRQVPLYDSVPVLLNEAADRIDALEAGNARLREALKQIAALGYGALGGWHDHQVIAQRALAEGGLKE